ncbi:MAG: proteasome accessory factor PafA2 family protein [bacterium]|nr:proteasome accessory factor PafA2 family protein [bacterium]MDZ4285567.1 proteasome accessory factor PafA2 family protein [Candidatus Sungbacteria bacterium]
MFVRDRAYGIETEYGCIARMKSGTVLAPEDFPAQFLQSYIRTYGANGGGLISDGDRLWNLNGSLVYIDTGLHPEHATPEVRSLRDAVMYYKAGDLLMADIFSSIRGDLSIELYKNNLSGGFVCDAGATYGCHENYLIYDYRAAPSELAKWDALIPFLVTRQIIDGAGCWDQEGSFFLSQRAFYMGRYRKESSVPLSVKDIGRMARMHVTVGDSNIMEFATFLKLGTFSLALSLAEAEVAPDMRIDRSIMAFYDVACSGYRDPVLMLRSGERVSALQVQTRYCEAARSQIKKARFQSIQAEAEFKRVLAYWEASLNALERNDIAWMLGRFDWATKKWFGRSGADEPQDTALERRRNLDVFYHALAPGSLQERINAHWPDRRIVTDEEIVRAKTDPPSGTRASSRGNLIRRMQALEKKFRVNMDWHCVTAGSPPKVFLHMDAPLKSYDDEVASFIHSGSVWYESLCSH